MRSQGQEEPDTESACGREAGGRRLRQDARAKVPVLVRARRQVLDVAQPQAALRRDLVVQAGHVPGALAEGRLRDAAVALVAPRFGDNPDAGQHGEQQRGGDGMREAAMWRGGEERGPGPRVL